MSDSNNLKEVVEYFEEELPAKVWINKYALEGEKTPSDMHRRIAKEFARIQAQKYGDKGMNEDEIFELLDNFRYLIPQGSPMNGIGNREQITSLSNCFGLASPEDSYGGIFKVDQQIAQICKRRGGVGVTISSLRPVGSETKNAAKSSSGLVSFAKRYMHTVGEVGQSGRRGAGLIACNVHHPEVVNFARSKMEIDTPVNISVQITDAFMRALERDGEYTQQFPVDSDNPSVKQRAKASEVWNEIVDSAWQMAEPGVLFWDTVLRESPADCYDDKGFRTVTCNPCAELPLSAFDSCRLMVVPLFSFVENPFTKDAKFNFGKFKEVVGKAQRLMDDLVDLELEKVQLIIDKIRSDPESMEVKQTELDLWEKIWHYCYIGRRTGLGTTGLGDTLAMLGIPYGSKQSIETIDSIFKTLKLEAYRASVDMAQDIGAFEVYDTEKEKDCPFIQRIAEEDPNLYKRMRKHGRRNIAILTLAPTGTVSVLAQCSSGVEPLYSMSYTRWSKVTENDKHVKIERVDEQGNKWTSHQVYHPKIKQWEAVTGESDIKKSPWFGCCAEDLDWKQRVDVQATIQKHIDHSISSTLNLPEDVDKETVKKIYETAWKQGCKGVTVYRNNCRKNVLSIKNALEERIHKTTAPKRPKVLKCDIHHPTKDRQSYYVSVGLFGEDPYEVFVGLNYYADGSPMIPKSATEGHNIKIKRGDYELLTSSNSRYNLTEDMDDKVNSLTRLISLSLRHGVDITFIVQQLEKARGEMQSFSKVLARTLKKYIPDGTKVSGENCPCCGAGMIRENGCIMCKNCGYSRCM